MLQRAIPVREPHTVEQGHFAAGPERTAPHPSCITGEQEAGGRIALL